MFCCWNITWLYMYLSILLLLNASYLLLYLTKINLSVYFCSVHISTKFVINKEKKTFLSGDLYVLYVMLWNISFSGWHFFSVLQVVLIFSSCGQPWWQPLVNTGPISQFWENASSFNFLANSLGPLKNSHFGPMAIL